MEFVRKNRIPRSTTVRRGFLGYHPSPRIGAAQWFHEENLSSRRYPLLCPREPRRRLLQEPVEALASLNGLCYLSGNTLHYGEHSLQLPLSQGEKQLIPFGAYLVLMPDGLWVNTLDHSWDFCRKEAQFQGTVGIVWCRADGTAYETIVDGQDPPTNTAQMWLDTSTQPPMLRQWSELTGLWSKVEPTYLRIVHDHIGDLLEVGARVCFRENWDLEQIFGAGEQEILGKGQDFLVLRGQLDSIRKELREQSFVLRAPMPVLDLVLQHENRLWGCRYGLNEQGNFVNEIYASKLGDFTSWYAFRGISTDSFVASLGTEGPFTGAAVVGGYPVFFKEHSLHRIYGSRPSNFRISSLPCVGVALGSERSTVLLQNRLFYHGADGFYVYDGSTPDKCSEELDSKSYTAAVAGVLGERCYVSALEDGKSPVLLCYDAAHRLWHREDGVEAKEFCTVGERLYYRTGEGLFAIGGTEGSPAEEQVSWEAVSGILREEEPGKGYLAAMELRLSMEPDSCVSFFAEYDSCGAWEPLGSVSGLRLNSAAIPLRPKRCDHLRLKLRGRGECTLHSLCLTMEG